jgi:hypothetical protein
MACLDQSVVIEKKFDPQREGKHRGKHQGLLELLERHP